MSDHGECNLITKNLEQRIWTRWNLNFSFFLPFLCSFHFSSFPLYPRPPTESIPLYAIPKKLSLRKYPFPPPPLTQIPWPPLPHLPRQTIIHPYNRPTRSTRPTFKRTISISIIQSTIPPSLLDEMTRKRVRGKEGV